MVDRKVVAYTQAAWQPAEQLQEHLERSKRMYRHRMLLSVYDVRLCVGLAQSLYDETLKNEMAFNGEILPYLAQLLQQIKELQSVSEAFQRQLERLSGTADSSLRTERVHAARRYFADRWKKIVALIRHSPAQTDDEEVARTYNEGMCALFEEVTWRRHLMDRIGADDEVSRYFSLKQRFKAPHCPVNAYVDPYAEIARRAQKKEKKDKKKKD
jgi:hypothetical protein